MKKIISIILSILLIATCTACGRYNKLEPSKALHSSPELNVKDEYYTAALKEGPVVLADWVLNDRHGQIKEERLTNIVIGISKYNEFENVFKIDVPFDTFISGYNPEDKAKLVEEGVPTESMEDRYNWEVKNQFMFSNYTLKNIDVVQDEPKPKNFKVKDVGSVQKGRNTQKKNTGTIDDEGEGFGHRHRTGTRSGASPTGRKGVNNTQGDDTIYGTVHEVNVTARIIKKIQVLIN